MEVLAVSGALNALPSPQFWSGKRVFLTGHTGFKGGWMALWLQRMGAQVTGFALPPETQPALYNLANIGGACTSVFGDLRELNAVNTAITAAQPEIVLHLAAQPIVKHAISDPLETLTSNIIGTANLLEALRGCGSVRTILVVTSDKVYANADDGVAHTESGHLGGKDPYSASKAACEIVTRSYAQTYFAAKNVHVATARGGNVIGGGDYSADRIVPDIVRAAQNNEKPLLRMPQATRPWQHVLDCLCGYLLYAEALDTGINLPLALNFGPDFSAPVTVADMTRAMLAALGRPTDFMSQSIEGSVEMATLAIDASLARRCLNWHDQLKAHKIIEWTAQWYQRVHQNHAPRDVTLAQIDAYCARNSAA